MRMEDGERNKTITLLVTRKRERERKTCVEKIVFRKLAARTSHHQKNSDV